MSLLALLLVLAHLQGRSSEGQQGQAGTQVIFQGLQTSHFDNRGPAGKVGACHRAEQPPDSGVREAEGAWRGSWRSHGSGKEASGSPGVSDHLLRKTERKGEKGI